MRPHTAENFFAAPIRADSGYFLFIGIIRDLTSSVAPCRLIASLYGKPIPASFSILSAIPQVETVIRRAPNPNLSGALNTARAAIRLSKFASGSPIPITTMFSNSNLASFLPFSTVLFTNGNACATISHALRLRTNPRIAEAQNLHPHAHPTCVLTHSVLRILPSSADGASSRTHSTKLPSDSLNRYFFVLSSDFLPPTISAGSKSNLSDRYSASFDGIEGNSRGLKIFLA